MPILKFVRTRPNHEVEYFNPGDNVFQILAMRYPYDGRTYLMGDAGLSRVSEFTFASRDVLDAYLNDPQRWAKRDEANAYDIDHGITTRVAVLDGENSGPARFNSTTSMYDITPTSEADAEAWVTAIAGSITP
jgi:hypothetical protein